MKKELLEILTQTAQTQTAQLMDERKTSVLNIIEKCKQYWDVDNIGDAEIHAALAYIYSNAMSLRGGLTDAQGGTGE